MTEYVAINCEGETTNYVVMDYEGEPTIIEDDELYTTEGEWRWDKWHEHLETQIWNPDKCRFEWEDEEEDNEYWIAKMREALAAPVFPHPLDYR